MTGFPAALALLLSMLCGGALLASAQPSFGDVCYVPAAVPFETEAEAQSWANVYCECPDKYLAASGNAAITHLWEYMHGNDVDVFVDGYQYPNWRFWNAQIVKAHRLMTHSTVQLCSMTGYTKNSIQMQERMALVFALPLPGYGTTEVTPLVVTTDVDITFKAEGTFSSKVYTSSGNVAHTLLMLLGNAGNSGVASATALVPQSLINAFFKDTETGIIVFVGCVALVMYLALLYMVLKVTQLCLTKSGLCGKAKSKSVGGRGKGYQMVDHSALFSSSTATEVDTGADVDDKL